MRFPAALLCPIALSASFIGAPFLSVAIVELGIPVRATSLWRPIQHQPERIKIRTATRILSRVGHRRAHFGAVEVANDSIAPAEDAEAGDVGVFRAHVGPCVLTGQVRNERE